MAVIDVQKNSFDKKWYVVELDLRNRPTPISQGYTTKQSAYRKRMKMAQNKIFNKN